MSPRARAARIAAAFALPPAVVAGLVAGLLGGVIPGVVVVVVVGLVLAGWARYAGDAQVRRAIGGRPADPAFDARLCNLVDGLSMGAGVRPPELRVLDSPGLNALAAAARPERGLLAVTSGLLRALDRIELEAVLAEQLVRLRREEVLPATVVAATFGVGRRWAGRREQDALADQAAVVLTRYPPGLVAALEKIEAGGAGVTGAPPRLAGLWLADPSPLPGGEQAPAGARPRAGHLERLPLRERIEALREL